MKVVMVVIILVVSMMMKIVVVVVVMRIMIGRPFLLEESNTHASPFHTRSLVARGYAIDTLYI